MKWYPYVYFTSQKFTACIKEHKLIRTITSHFKLIPSLPGLQSAVLTSPVLIVHIDSKPMRTWGTVYGVNPHNGEPIKT